ncbi:MAG: 16S rRNA (cytosine(1402)-N(4))-methyltransferase RsmH [Hyphomonadaceae bacterium]
MGGHNPVMLAEVLRALAPADNEIHVDGTFGGGGYANAILSAADCRLIGIDRDLDAIQRAEAIAINNPRLVPLLGRFSEMDALVEGAGFDGVDGIVLDLGVSSFQIDEADRGFSFMRDGPLDMRMGQAGPSAADVVNHMAEKDLANVIFRLGEEKQSRRIARRITERRKTDHFTGTLDLANTVEAAVGGRKGAKTHPATRTFQAIRMYVNDELGQLAQALAAAERILRVGGRLVVVTFHSLEDRIVKNFMRKRAGLQGAGSRHLPLGKKSPPESFALPSRKAIPPSEAETKANPRSRSARLRVAIRTEAPAWDTPVETSPDLPPLNLIEATT